jgi:RND family efflux transporter MFP subunit
MSAATSSPATEPRRRAVRLDLRGPLILGFSTIVLFFGAGVGGAAYAPIDKGIGMPGTIIVESKVKPVQHQRGGLVGKVHVGEGQEVKAGDLLVSLDTTVVDEQIAALRTQAEAARKQLQLAKEEAATMTDLLERKLAAKSRVLALERSVAEIEKDIAGLNAKIAMAMQELQQSEIRAPFGGRVLTLAVNGKGAVVQPGATVMELVPEDDRLVIEGRIAPNQIENVKPGMPAKVWLSALSWREQRPLRARLAWVSPDSVEDKRTGAPYFVARVELAETRSQIAKRMTLLPGMRAEILLQTGERTLLDQVVDPLMRNINRAFRG